jgi:hypothetical protein
MITIKIDEEKVVDMLIDRLKFWTDDTDLIALYEQMYKSYIDCGVFESVELDPMIIVDNDYINYCDVISPEDNCYDDIKSLFDRDGLGDISCDYELNSGYSFIEAEHNGYFLVRY